MDISAKLKQRRKELSLTMLEVAQRVGVSEATISRWESGDIANMRRDKIVTLANALNVSPAFIMGWDDESAIISQEQQDRLPSKDDMTIAMFKQLDNDDKAEIRGEIKQMLKADKYVSGTDMVNAISQELKNTK